MPNWTKGLGNASYSVYLMHMPLGFAMMAWTQKWSHAPLAHFGWSLAMVSVCIGGGLLLYRLVEKPMMELVKKKTEHENTKERKHERKTILEFVVTSFRTLVFLRK
jgi:peptidoglycan/LPS O-acetylase OafA/YrhL